MATEIVPTGDMVISGKRKGALEAYLGSCVGVTLRDNSAGLGGMIHVLLPEPTGTDTPYGPGTYASTGIPRFIELMLSEGASSQTMEACIAGGGLLGPVSEQDLFLDIGGRTTEMAGDILQGEGIRIIKAETGGMFSYQMTLCLEDLETNVQPMAPDGLHMAEEFNESHETVNIEYAISKVKPIPQIALKVLRMIRDQDYDMQEVASEIKQDQVISAEILEMCNRVSPGLGRKVDSIDRAIVVLGERKLFQLVVSASLSKVLPEKPGAYSLCKGGLFQHALATAMMSHELSVFTGKSKPDVAYTAGLLHDIGKVPLDQYMAAKRPLFYRELQKRGVELCQMEKEYFGVSHTEAGALLGELWELPPNLVEVIKYHHRPEMAGEDRDLVNLVFLANLIISRFHPGRHLSLSHGNGLEKRLNDLGLGPDQLPVIIDRIPRAVFEISVIGA